MPYGDWCEYCQGYHDPIDDYRRFIDTNEDCLYPPVQTMIEQKRGIIEKHEYSVMIKEQEKEDKDEANANARS